jgi:hypothetical protein
MMNPGAVVPGLRVVTMDPHLGIHRRMYGTVIELTSGTCGDDAPPGALVDLDELGPTWCPLGELTGLDAAAVRLDLPDDVATELTCTSPVDATMGSALVDMWRAEATRARVVSASWELWGDPPGSGRLDGSGSIALAGFTAECEQYLLVLIAPSALTPAMVGARRSTRHESW